MSFTLRLMTLLRGYRLAMAAVVALGLLYTLTSLVPPLIVRGIFHAIVEQRGTTDEVVVAAILVAGVAILRGLSHYGEGVISHIVAYRILHKLLLRVYDHVQYLPHRFFTNRSSGALVSRMSNDVEEIEFFIAHGVGQAFQAALIPFAMIAVLFVLNWQLALFTLAPLPLAAFIVFGLSPRFRRRWVVVREQLARLHGFIQEGLEAVNVVKSFTREREQMVRLGSRSKRFRDEIIDANVWTLIPPGAMEVLAILGLAIIVWQGGAMGMSGLLPIGDLFVFIVYLAYIYQPLLRLAELNEGIQTAMASSQRVFELLDIESEIVDRPNAVAPADIDWTIELDRVTFGYDPARPVLQDVAFSVREGETVALVGPTGAGKTTTVNLITRFYDVQLGRVMVGGRDVRDLKLEFLRRNIAMVLQDVFLFNGSVRENLLFGRPDASDDEIVAAARAANADEFIVQLPDLYDTVIGERGVRLSGGQKQRLSIARALLKNAPIIILDEATSSVDSESELLIQEAMSNLVAQRTTIVIAHRLSTVRNADRLLVLNQGRIVETGTHDDLIAADGFYAGMIRAYTASRNWTVRAPSSALTATN